MMQESISEKRVYTAMEISKKLGLGKTKTYEFLNAVYKEKMPPFRVIKIGTSIRVPKSSFDAWLEGIA